MTAKSETQRNSNAIHHHYTFTSPLYAIFLYCLSLDRIVTENKRSAYFHKSDQVKVAQNYIPLCIKMSDSEIQKEIENGGGGGGFDFSQPAASANTVAVKSGKSMMKPRDFVNLLKKRSDVQSIEQRRESFLEECCASNTVVDLDIRAFDITEDFSQQDRDHAIDELCEVFRRPELILKRLSFVEPAPAFRNLTNDLRAEETQGVDPQTFALQTILDVEKALLKTSSSSTSDGYVLLDGDDSESSGGSDFSLIFQTSYTIVQRDDAGNAEIFAVNFPRALKDQSFARRLIELEKEIARARLNVESQMLRANHVDERTPKDMVSILRDQIRQQLAGPLQDQFFSLSLKRNLLNIIDEIVNLSPGSSLEAATVKTESIIPRRQKQTPAPNSDSIFRSSVDAKFAKVTLRSTAKEKERFKHALDVLVYFLQTKSLIALYQFHQPQRKWE